MEMNALEKFITLTGTDPIAAMNLLQDQGVVSDNCIWPHDVADVDCDRAVKFLVMDKGELI